MTKKTALITGITGQDGSYLAELLLKEGYKVIGVARRVSVDTSQRIKHILHQIKVVEGDITDQFCVTNIIKSHQPDEIYNLAAQSHVGTSFKQPSLTWEITAGGCLNILESIKSLGLCDKVKFYQASSSEMFGRNYDIRTYPIHAELEALKYQDENTPFKPQSPYAIAKLAAHHLVDNYRRSYGVFACSGILFNHESERRGDQFVTRKITKWIGNFSNWLERNNLTKDLLTKTDSDCDLIFASGHQESFPKLRLGNLEARRDWGHAEDYVRAMWLMMQQDKPEDYVVSTFETHSVEDFLDAAFKCIGIENWSGLVVTDQKYCRPAEVDYLLGNCSKARNDLSWQPHVSFQELVERMVKNDINEAKL